MSIKSELKDKLRKEKEEQKKQEGESALEASKFIEEFIIPKFREISKKRPTLSILQIQFHNTLGGLFYTSSVESWDCKKASTYDPSIIMRAVQIANDFEIEAKSMNYNEGGEEYTFTLDLDT